MAAVKYQRAGGIAPQHTPSGQAVPSGTGSTDGEKGGGITILFGRGIQVKGSSGAITTPSFMNIYSRNVVCGFHAEHQSGRKPASVFSFTRSSFKATPMPGFDDGASRPPLSATGSVRLVRLRFK